MKSLLTTLSLIVILSSCSQRLTTQASNSRVQETMREVDKTDYAKIDINHKNKVEQSRQDKYHSYANETDKKLNHQKNENINKRKGWDSEFSFY